MSYYILSKCCSKNIRHSFTDKEDEQLKKLVLEYGEHDWKTIAENLGTRTPRQCRERYRNYLMPGIVNGPWTVEDDMLLYQKYLEIGPHWTIISQFFPSRSEINIKNRWAALSNKRNNKNHKQNSSTTDTDLSSSSSSLPQIDSSDQQTTCSQEQEKIITCDDNKLISAQKCTENENNQANDEMINAKDDKFNEAFESNTPKVCQINSSFVETLTPVSSSSVKTSSDEEEIEPNKKILKPADSFFSSSKSTEDRKQEILFSMIEQDLFSFNFDPNTENVFPGSDFNLFFK